MFSANNSLNCSTSTTTTSTTTISSSEVTVSTPSSLKNRLSNIFSPGNKKSTSVSSSRSPVSSVTVTTASTLLSSCSLPSVTYESSEADVTLSQSALHSTVTTVPEVLGKNSLPVSSSPVDTIHDVLVTNSRPESVSLVATATSLLGTDSQPVSPPRVASVAVNLDLTPQSVSFSPVATMGHSSQITSPSPAAAVSLVSSPTSLSIFSPMHELSPITSSTKCTTPTTSLVDSYRLTTLISPSTCIDTTQTHTTFTTASISSIFENSTSMISGVSQLSNVKSDTTNLKESNPSTDNVYPSTPAIASLSSQVHSVELWNRKTPSELAASSDNCDYYVNPYGLQEVLSLMVRRIDNLAETSDSLVSKTNIMANSLHTALSEKIDRQFQEINKQVSDQLETLRSDMEKETKDVVADIEEIRGTLDKNMEGVRLRVRRILNEDSSLLSEDEGGGVSTEHEPTPCELEIIKLNAELTKLKDECYKLDCRVIQTEQYPRRESMVFNGIPASIPHKDLENTVFDILVNIGFEKLRMDDICRVHRLWSPPSSREPAPVIVKFMNSKIVEWSFDHPENLKKVKENMGIDLTMSESLCSKNAESLKICKWLKQQGKIHNYFSRNGFAKVVQHAGNRPVKIAHPGMLRDRFEVPTFDVT